MDAQDGRQSFSRNPSVEDLVKLCRALNDAGVQYVVIGGFAVAHQGYLRATGDIDLLIDATPNNVEKIRQALSYLPDKAILDVKPTDVQDYSVVRVADELVIDLLQQACGVTYGRAKDDVEPAVIDGVTIPFLGLRSLIQTKQSLRPQDVQDRAFLEEKRKIS